MSAPVPWLEAARLAPSAHNTQPWRFVALPDGRTHVRWDPGRTLPVSDPTARDLYLALGAAVESARLRSAEQTVPVRFTPARENRDRLVGWLAPNDLPPDPSDQRLAPFLEVRQTARTPHLPRPLPGDLVAALTDEARLGGCRLYILQDQARISRLARLARRATAIQFADLAVHAAKAALAQSGVKPEDVDNVVFGNVMQTSPDAIYCARHVGLKAGLPITTPALTVTFFRLEPTPALPKVFMEPEPACPSPTTLSRWLLVRLRFTSTTANVPSGSRSA